MTVASGDLFRRSGSSGEPSSPTGPQTASAPSKKRPARTGRRLFAFDRSLDRPFVAGADEAGRGPLAAPPPPAPGGGHSAARGSLAGPLVAAAVLFDIEQLTLSERRSLARLNDSKQHTEAGREELYPLVLRAAAKASIVVRCVRGIDSRGLHRTNLEALRTALKCVAREDAICLVDGFRLGEIGYEQRAVVGGDSTSAAIAAASVLAKVTRDRYMRRAANRHPGWDFETNVGYSTPEHRAAIAVNGVSPLHRMSFASIAYQQLPLGG